MLDHDTVLADVQALSRGPFRAVLARLLDNAPTDEAIVNQAEKNPDRWAQTVALIARLGGYNEKLEIEGNVTHRLAGMSDAELMATVEALIRQLDGQSTVRREPAIPVED